ncbi:hypothetical protein [Helicobacter pylori]|uniref:hypothetical protein n=1 Tax=Helicobacter pylori TaxID=210 RepID=UPI0012ADBBA1|nr:hypothetical protein [Helicobacter pylori]
MRVFQNERSFCFFKASDHSAMHFLKRLKRAVLSKPPQKKDFRKGGVLEEGF